MLMILVHVRGVEYCSRKNISFNFLSQAISVSKKGCMKKLPVFEWCNLPLYP